MGGTGAKKRSGERERERERATRGNDFEMTGVRRQETFAFCSKEGRGRVLFRRGGTCNSFIGENVRDQEKLGSCGGPTSSRPMYEEARQRMQFFASVMLHPEMYLTYS